MPQKAIKNTRYFLALNRTVIKRMPVMIANMGVRAIQEASQRTIDLRFSQAKQEGRDNAGNQN